MLKALHMPSNQRPCVTEVQAQTVHVLMWRRSKQHLCLWTPSDRDYLRWMPKSMIPSMQQTCAKTAGHQAGCSAAGSVERQNLLQSIRWAQKLNDVFRSLITSQRQLMYFSTCCWCTHHPKHTCTTHAILSTSQTQQMQVHGVVQSNSTCGGQAASPCSFKETRQNHSRHIYLQWYASLCSIHVQKLGAYVCVSGSIHKCRFFCLLFLFYALCTYALAHHVLLYQRVSLCVCE